MRSLTVVAVLVLVLGACTGENIWGELEPYTASANATFTVSEIFPNITGPVAPNVVMTVRFSAPVDHTSIIPGGNLHLIRKGATSEAVAFTPVLQSDGRSVNLAPATVLQRSSQYEIRVDGGIKANSGSALTNTISRSFTTASGPVVTSMTPARDSTVGGDVSSITLNFSESILPETAVVTVSDPQGSTYDYPLSGSAVTADAAHTSFVIDVTEPLPWTPPDLQMDREIKLTINGVKARLDDVAMDSGSSVLMFKIRPWWYPTGGVPSVPVAAVAEQMFDLDSDGSRLWLVYANGNAVNVFANSGTGFSPLVTITLGNEFTATRVAATPANGNLYVLIGGKNITTGEQFVSWCLVSPTPSGPTLGLNEALVNLAQSDSLFAIHAVTDTSGPRFGVSFQGGSGMKHQFFKSAGNGFVPDREIDAGGTVSAAFVDAGAATLFHAAGQTLVFDSFAGSGSLPLLPGTWGAVSGISAARWSGLAWAAVGESSSSHLFRYENGGWLPVTAQPSGFSSSAGATLRLYPTQDRLYLGYSGGSSGYTVAGWRGSWEVPPHLTGKPVQDVQLAWFNGKLYAAFIAEYKFFVRECYP